LIFLRLGDLKLHDLANLWCLKLAMTQYNFQEYQIWRHFVTSSNYDVTKISIFKSPP